MSVEQVQLEKVRAWSLPALAVGIGVLAIAASCIVAVGTYFHLLSTAETADRDLYHAQALFMATEAGANLSLSRRDVVAKIDRLWSVVNRQEGKYVRIVDENVMVIYHSADPYEIGKIMAYEMMESEKGKFMLKNLLELREQEVMSGRQEGELITVSTVPGRGWLLSIHRPGNMLKRRVAKEAWALSAGYVLVSALLMPLSLALMYCAYWATKRGCG